MPLYYLYELIGTALSCINSTPNEDMFAKESIDDKSEARTAAANYCYTVYNFLLIVPSLRNAVDIVL